MPSFKKSLIVEQFQGNYLAAERASMLKDESVGLRTVLIVFLCTQATDEIQRLRRQVSQARSPSPSRAASAVLTRVESERDEALAELRRSNAQLDNLEDKFKVRCGNY